MDVHISKLDGNISPDTDAFQIDVNIVGQYFETFSRGGSQCPTVVRIDMIGRFEYLGIHALNKIKHRAALLARDQGLQLPDVLETPDGNGIRE